MNQARIDTLNHALIMACEIKDIARDLRWHKSTMDIIESLIYSIEGYCDEEAEKEESQ